MQSTLIIFNTSWDGELVQLVPCGVEVVEALEFLSLEPGEEREARGEEDEESRRLGQPQGEEVLPEGGRHWAVALLEGIVGTKVVADVDDLRRRRGEEGEETRIRRVPVTMRARRV